MSNEELKTLGKIFVEEANEFLSEIKGRLKQEAENSVDRMSIHLQKAVTTGNWEQYGQEMKFEASVLASTASISSDKAEKFMVETTKRTVHRAIGLLFAAI